MMFLKRASVLLSLFIWAPFAFAQTGSITLMHDSVWEINGHNVNIHVAHIVNSSTEDTGSLFLSLYAQRPVPYDGGPARGQLIARTPIDSIPASTTVDNLDVTARLRAVRPGLRYTALMIERKEGRRFAIVDWVSYTSLYSFPLRQSGGVGSDDSQIGRDDITVSGLAVSVTGRRATFSVTQIQNRRETDTTGLLRLSVYAIPADAPEGTVTGRLLGTRLLGALAPGDYYSNLGSVMLLRPRPRNTTYRLVLEERQNDAFVPITSAVPAL